MTMLLERSLYRTDISTENRLHDISTTLPKSTHQTTPLQFGELNNVATAQNTPMIKLATPRASKEEVSQTQAASDLEEVFQTLQQLSPDNERNNTSNPMLNMSLAKIEGLPMNSMFAASLLLVGQVLGDIASTKGEMLEILTKKQDMLRMEEVKNIREQMEKAVEQQDKARKAGVFGVIFDWVIAAVEVVVGVTKMVGGFLSGNAMMAASGSMDFMAGLAGIGKAVANTMALIDPNNAEKYHAAANKFAITQMSFELMGAAIDITSAVRNAIATKIVPKVATQVLKEGAGEALNAAIKEGSQTTIKGIAKSVGQEVSTQIGNQIINQLGKQAAEKAGKTIFNKMIDSFSQKAIEELVTKSVEKAAKKAAKKVAKDGIELTTEQLISNTTRQIQKDVLKAVSKASVSRVDMFLQTSRGVISGAQQVTIGSLEIQKAKLQKQIDQLMLDQTWLQNMFEFFEREKEETVKKVRSLQEDKAAVVQDGTKLLSTIASTQAHIASSMV
ncbi:type III secretion system translocon subunit SctE [Providencia rettgeri]